LIHFYKRLINQTMTGTEKSTSRKQPHRLRKQREKNQKYQNKKNERNPSPSDEILVNGQEPVDDNLQTKFMNTRTVTVLVRKLRSRDYLSFVGNNQDINRNVMKTASVDVETAAGNDQEHVSDYQETVDDCLEAVKENLTVEQSAITCTKSNPRNRLSLRIKGKRKLALTNNSNQMTAINLSTSGVDRERHNVELIVEEVTSEPMLLHGYKLHSSHVACTGSGSGGRKLGKRRVDQGDSQRKVCKRKLFSADKDYLSESAESEDDDYKSSRSPVVYSNPRSRKNVLNTLKKLEMEGSFTNLLNSQ